MKNKIDPIVMSVIRSVMPQVLAQSIIGVQPMTGITGSIFDKSLYRYTTYSSRNCAFTKNNYKHFLRLNNRKKYQKPDDIIAAGYKRVSVNSLQKGCYEDIINLDGACVYFHNVIYFAHDEDAALFAVKWA